MVDVRFLPNPYWIPSSVASAAPTNPSATTSSAATGGEFLERFIDMFRSMLDGYRHEGKSFITVAVGCTGGHHRSVAVSEELGRRLRELPDLDVNVMHRDIARG